MKEEIIDVDERGNLLAAESTTNYGLIKPGQDDFYNVDDFNQNMDTIDQQLKVNENQIKNLENQIEGLNTSWDGITGKPPTFPPSPHADHAEINTGLIKGKALTTSNKQLVNHTSDAMYVGNPTIALSLESKDEIRANIGGKVKTVLHNESIINADTVDGKHASDFPLKSQGIGGNAPIWDGENLNDLPIGIYTTKATGVPEAGAYHIVMCVYNDVSLCRFQIAMSQVASGNNGHKHCRMYCRTLESSVWSDWSPMDGASLGYSDARSEGNKQPSWYVVNKRMGMTVELNAEVANGMPGGGMFHVVTILPWYDITGGISQTATSTIDGSMYRRHALSDTVWSAWERLDGGGDVAGKTYVKATRTVENTGNPNSNLEVINYTNAKGGVCKIAQFGSAKMQIIVDGAMVLDGTGTNSYYSNHEFLMGDLSDGYGELPTYPFKNNVKVVDRSSNAGTRVYTAHFYVNS